MLENGKSVLVSPSGVGISDFAGDRGEKGGKKVAVASILGMLFFTGTAARLAIRVTSRIDPAEWQSGRGVIAPNR